MTSPDETTARLAQAAAATGGRPQLSWALATSDLSAAEMGAVGGFAQAMQLSVTRRLAANSGARTNFSADELNQLNGIGEHVAQEDEEEDSRSFWEKATDWVAGAVSNTGNALLHNPVTDAALDAFTWLGNAAKLPVRILSDQLDPANDDEIDARMRAEGYDPESTASYIAFMFGQSEDVYHDLSSVRDVYGDDLVDLALQMHADPEEFHRNLTEMDPTEAATLQEKLNSQDFIDAFDAVDRKHISPGRDLARLLLPEGDPTKSGFWTEDGKLFTALSGAADAAYLWFTDPFMILGRAAQVARGLDAITGASTASRLRPSTWVARGWDKARGGKQRAGLSPQSMIDGSGIEQLMRTDAAGNAVTRVGKAWQRFLKDADDLRLADEAGDEAARAGIFSVMQQRYGPLMGMLDEINGARVIPDAAHGGITVDRLTNASLVETKTGPITSLDGPNGLVEYLTSTNGLLRLTNGFAARETIVMPGKLSLVAERTAAAEAKTLLTRRNKANKVTRWIDYTRAHQLLPDDAERALLDEIGDSEVARAGLAQARLVNQSALNQAARGHLGEAWRTIRARSERVTRRLTTQLPGVQAINLTDPNSAKTVEQFARLYLNRGDAAKLASAYALGDLAARRAIMRGILVQSFHASGLSRSEAGRTFMQRFIGDQADLEKQKYGFGDTSRITTDRGDIEVALYPDQISQRVILPSFREMNYLAAKFAVAGFAGRTGAAHVTSLGQSPGMDRLMTTIKLGWITTAAGGLRNAIDEFANFAAYGMGRDVLAGRVAFTRATKEHRALRREAARERIELIGELGRKAADDRIATRAAQGLKSYDDAKVALERAQSARAAIDAVPGRLSERVTEANTARAEVYTYRYRALQELEDGKKAGLAEAQLGPLRERATYWSDEVAKAEREVAAREKVAKNPQAEIDKVRQRFADRGVLSPDRAARDLARAQKELERATRLQYAISHRLPYFVRGVADTVNDVFIGAVLGKAMSVLGKDWAITGDRVKYASELTDYELTRTLRDGVFQSHHADVQLLQSGDVQAMEIHRAGLMARRYSFRSTGWGMVEADGGAGLDAMAKVLQLRFADARSPAHSWVQTLRHTMPGKPPASAQVTREEWEEAMQAARDSVRLRLDDEDLIPFIEQAEVFRWYKGASVGKDPELLKLAKDEYADRVSADLAAALARRDGKGINRDLLDELASGRVPDRSWLAHNLPPRELPEQTIGQLWAPYNPAHEPGQMARGYTGMLVKAYDKVVTDQINALSRNPLVTALYMRARHNTEPWVRHLQANGWSTDVAEDMARRISLQHAEAEALKHVDNPFVSSQASLLSRNYFAFVRAQEDWLRRWGRTIKDNPDLIRKAQLLIHGGESAGFLEVDDQGELHFVYPGSGLMVGVLNKFFGLLGQENLTRIPVTGELSSQLTWLNPSLDNPLGLSGTPVLSLPFRALKQIMGDDSAIWSASMDQIVNGQMGAGREWWEQMLPTFANRIIGSVIDTGDQSRLAQAQMATIANLEAAGLLDDPQYQTPEGKAKLLHALQVGTQNDLIMSAILGFFAPAAPQYEATADENADGFQGNDADWSAHILGLRSLKDEAREIFSRLPYEEAKLWWLTVHPNESVLAPTGVGSRTEVGTEDASAPASLAAASYIEDNLEFFGNYGGRGGIAAYFIPMGRPGTKNGEFSDIAYRAQLEMGIRDYKSVDDYFDDIVTARGNATYFAEKERFDQLVESAGGSQTLSRQYEQQWATRKAEIYAANPLLAVRHAEQAAGNAIAGSTRQRLYQLANDESESTLRALGPNRDGLLLLLSAQDEYEQAVAALDGRRGNAATRRRSLIRSNYERRIDEVSAQYPGLADLARGAFRLPS